jgi:amino acid permease
LVYGPIWISVIGMMSVFSVYMLIKIKNITGEASYSSFAEKWWGLPGKIFILILNCLSSFGSCLSYIGTFNLI